MEAILVHDDRPGLKPAATFQDAPDGAGEQMPHHHVQVWVHLAWHVHGRCADVTTHVQRWLWPSIANKAREMGCADVVVAGVGNHVHVLGALPVAVAVAQLAQRLKGASSRALHFGGREDFAWQEGYGAFSVSCDNVQAVTRYVRNQPPHHATGTAEAGLEWRIDALAQPVGHLDPEPRTSVRGVNIATQGIDS